MAASSSCWRVVSEAGSKVLTNPGKLGSELLEQLREGLVLLDGHPTIVAAAPHRLAVSGRGGARLAPGFRIRAQRGRKTREGRQATLFQRAGWHRCPGREGTRGNRRFPASGSARSAAEKTREGRQATLFQWAGWHRCPGREGTRGNRRFPASGSARSAAEKTREGRHATLFQRAGWHRCPGREGTRGNRRFPASGSARSAAEKRVRDGTLRSFSGPSLTRRDSA